MTARAERRVSEALVRYLQSQVSGAEPWTVDVALDPAQTRLVASGRAEISVRGGAPPWVGAQRFEVTARSSEGPVRFHVDAKIALPASVVVAAEPLARGAVIRAADVRLAPNQVTDGAFHAIDRVIGQQTTRAIPAGTILDRDSIRPPLLVRRGETVAVYARSAGIQVRTAAKAREEGSLGDLIEVESLTDRATYFVRVCGIQEVEVYARATRADRAAAIDSDRTRR
jgi:flagella basal body P-ring formation protein FlgA